MAQGESTLMYIGLGDSDSSGLFTTEPGTSSSLIALLCSMASVICGDCGETDLSHGSPNDFDGQWYCFACWSKYDHQCWGTGFLNLIGAPSDGIGLHRVICEPGICILISSFLHGEGGPFQDISP
jgi:hypothetical protein